jgi:hypothetical protein
MRNYEFTAPPPLNYNVPTDNERITTMATHTYSLNAVAHYNDGYAIVPDCVAKDQIAWADSFSSFPAVPCYATGAIVPGADPVFVWLDGDAYGLGSPGTGDMVVRDAGGAAAP